MEKVIVAFEQESQGRRLQELLESGGVAACVVCRSGDEVRRLLAEKHCVCVICSPRLADGPAEWLCPDVPPCCSMLMVGPQHQLDLCSDPDVYRLPTPIRREEAILTVRLLLQFSHRLEKLSRPKRGAAEQQEVDRAKRRLMERKGVSEEEAHRLLQRRSMDEGKSLAQTARKVYLELEGDV